MDTSQIKEITYMSNSIYCYKIQSGYTEIGIHRIVRTWDFKTGNRWWFEEICTPYQVVKILLGISCDN